jgi:hypothetical protein
VYYTENIPSADSLSGVQEDLLNSLGTTPPIYKRHLSGLVRYSLATNNYRIPSKTKISPPYHDTQLKSSPIKNAADGSRIYEAGRVKTGYNRSIDNRDKRFSLQTSIGSLPQQPLQMFTPPTLGKFHSTYKI